MTEHRIFSKTIVESDTFLDMPLSAQALYFHLCLLAGKEGTLNNTFAITRAIGGSQQDIKELCENGFIKPKKDGTFEVVHWKINNNINDIELEG